MNDISKRNGGPGSIGVDLALVHYPVVNKNKDTIGSAITNLDLHDIARAARTYGVDTLYMVTPYRDQHRLIEEILQHWFEGHGARYNSKRGEALALVRVCTDLTELYTVVTNKWGEKPKILITSAGQQGDTWPYSKVRRDILSGGRFLILFGTGWGLAPEAMKSADGALPPLKGLDAYNHLSVRSAAAIILDRLLGERESVKV